MLESTVLVALGAGPGLFARVFNQMMIWLSKSKSQEITNSMWALKLEDPISESITLPRSLDNDVTTDTVSLSSGSRTWAQNLLRTLLKHCRAIPPEFLTQHVWNGAQEFVFLTSSQVTRAADPQTTPWELWSRVMAGNQSPLRTTNILDVFFTTF